jgi:transcriptional regulator with GAF, ATPase, and Fis domain
MDFQLSAILCVPLRDRDRALGCLYLDKRRDAAGAFTQHTLRMIGAFADQVAVALLSARHMEALRHERDALRDARAQIEALLREREARLEDLATRCQRLEGDLAREHLRYDYDQIVAHAPAMRRVLAQLDRVLDSALPLVIQGESGTGKELIARAAHQQSARRHKPFVAINCGALSDALLESELFGHKKGAFTGATHDHKGLFEAAHGGTLFLDEVGEMSLAMQVKLLRALQERAIRPVGAAHELPVEVRVVAATNRDLRRMVHDGTFREDLYYRLATVTLALPPLRDRAEDIPLLAHRLLERAAQREGRPTPPRVTGEAVTLLCDTPWPGNIRQLENVLHTAMLLCDGDITAEQLRALLSPSDLARHDRHAPSRPALAMRGPRRGPGRPPSCSRDDVLAALDACHNDREDAARRLGISTRTLQRYLSADS